MSARLRVPVAEVRQGRSALDTETARYVTRVRRLEVGEGFVAFDPVQRLEADAKIASIDRTNVVVEIQAPRASTLVPTREITLLQCVGKGDKMSAVVRDATELGVTAVVPLTSARTIAEKVGGSSKRWERVAIEAARQCGRGDVPRIAPTMVFEEAVLAVTADVRLVMHPRAAATLGAALRPADHARSPTDVSRSVAVLVGPEGGFDDSELTRAAACGFVAVRLGSFVLRTETVAAAILGAIIALSEL